MCGQVGGVMRAIFNEKTLRHRQVLQELFGEAEEIFISVAFFKSGGLAALAPALKTCLDAGGRVRMHIGQDFYLTDPDALEQLLKLSVRQPRCEVFVAGRSASTFHPKVYLAKGRDGGVSALIGSANLTGGALNANEEVSILVKGLESDTIAADLESWSVRLETDGRVRRLDRLALVTYRAGWEASRAARAAVEAAQEAATIVDVDLARLEILYARYLKSAEFKRLEERRTARFKAVTLQKAIADAAGARRGSAAAARVKTHLSHLMGMKDHNHLWPSDGIYRQGYRALAQPAQLAKVFATARASAALSPAEAYEAVRADALEVSGVGVNMISEILTTFRPKRFPVFNGNTAAALAALKLGSVKPLPKEAFRGWHYRLVTETVGAVRDRIGAADFPETDAFLNFIYRHELPRG